MTVIWQSPPKGKWERRLEPLKEKPGTWGLVHRVKSRGHASSIVNRLNSGIYKAPPGRYEYRSSGDGDGAAVYARYLGDA